MTPNVIGHIQVVAKGSSYSGLKPAKIAIVESKVPPSRLQTAMFKSRIAQATEIIHETSDRKHPKEYIWVNMTHAIDGAWGIAGKAYANAE